MNAESLAQAAASYLTLHLGPITLGPVETSIVVMALAAALLSGFNLWRIGRREERMARLAALRVGVRDPEQEAGETRIPVVSPVRQHRRGKPGGRRVRSREAAASSGCGRNTGAWPAGQPCCREGLRRGRARRAGLALARDVSAAAGDGDLSTGACLSRGSCSAGACRTSCWAGLPRGGGCGSKTACPTRSICSSSAPRPG